MAKMDNRYQQKRENYLVMLYFGPGDYLTRCVERAYRDFCRTLEGEGKSEESMKEEAVLKLVGRFWEIQEKPEMTSDQAAFDIWHEESCQMLVDHYNSGYRLTIGQAQKWINMTFKYIFTMGEERIPGFEGFYSFCHIPLDSIILEELEKPPYLIKNPWKVAWSKINHYGEYLDYQKRVREMSAPIAPLEMEFDLFMKGMNDRYMGK